MGKLGKTPERTWWKPVKVVLKGICLRLPDGSEKDSLGKVFGNMLFGSADGGGNSLKVYEIACKLHNEEEFELDRSDCDLLKRLVENSQTLPIISKGQILMFLRDLDK